jgi:hypothetical protein
MNLKSGMNKDPNDLCGFKVTEIYITIFCIAEFYLLFFLSYSDISFTP